jgi:hypothetical protein
VTARKKALEAAVNHCISHLEHACSLARIGMGGRYTEPEDAAGHLLWAVAELADEWSVLRAALNGSEVEPGLEWDLNLLRRALRGMPRVRPVETKGGGR